MLEASPHPGAHSSPPDLIAHQSQALGPLTSVDAAWHSDPCQVSVGLARRGVSLSPVPENASPVRHFEVTLSDAQQRPVERPRIFSFDCRMGGEHSLVVLDERGAHLFLTVEKPLPLALRAHLHPDSPGGAQEEILCLPRTALPLASSTPLGNRFFPSVGGSVEQIHFLTTSKDQLEQVAPATSLTPFTLRQVVEGFLDQKITDLCTVVAAFRAARAFGIPVSLEPRIKYWTNHSQYSGIIPRFSLEEAQRWILSPCPEGRVATITAREVPAPPNPFLSAIQVSRDSDTATVVRRRGVDAVDVIATCLIYERPHLLVTREIRPALAVNELLSNGGHEVTVTANALGGVAESLEGEDSWTGIGMRALQGIREEAGCEPLGTAMPLGFTHPNPRHSLERVYVCAAEVDPYKRSSCPLDVHEVVDYALIDAEDVLRLSDLGLLHDPRLELSAHLLLALADFESE